MLHKEEDNLQFLLKFSHIQLIDLNYFQAVFSQHTIHSVDKIH